MKKITVAYVVNDLIRGGFEKYVIDLANNLDSKLFNPLICCFRQVGNVAKRLKHVDVKIHRMGVVAGNEFFLPYKMAKLFLKERVDIVHSNNWGTFVESVIAAKLSHASLVHVQHGMEYDETKVASKKKRYMRNKIRQLTAHWADEIVTVSELGRKYVSDEWRFPQHKVKVIYNGVSSVNAQGRDFSFKKRRELGFLGDELIIGSVGRLMQVKNYPCLIKAMVPVVKEFPNARLVIAGDGPQEPQISSLVDSLQLTEHIHLLGYRFDIEELLNMMDIFSLSSFSEGMCLSILEAMSAGLPAVVTNVGGNPEIVRNRETGILVESDNPMELADSIIFLLRNPEKRKQMGLAARRRVVEKFSLQKMISAYEELYLAHVGLATRTIVDR